MSLKYANNMETIITWFYDFINFYKILNEISYNIWV